MACTSTYCNAFGNCPDFHCKGKGLITFKNSTQCGCCHVCVKEIDEGDVCHLEMTNNIPATQCGPHLYCNQKDEHGKSLCTKISEVLKEKGKYGCERNATELGQKMSELTAGKPIPQCDEFGDYSAKLCKNGTLCHCVDKEGKRIFGSTTYDKAKDMDCLCSRQFAQLNGQLSETVNYNIDAIYFLRCKPNGNYEPFQFVDNYTYCVNTSDGKIRERAVKKQDYDKLPCSNDKYDYKTDCNERYRKAIEDIKVIESEGYLVVGYDVPKCDLDGSYAPLQCLGSTCFCVNKKGEKYKDTEVDRNDRYYSEHQTCNCVRELELIRDMDEKSRDKVTELFSHYKCDINGNYFGIQCSDSVCYCVDPEFGYQSTSTVLKTSFKLVSEELSCYKKEYMEDILEQFF